MIELQNIIHNSIDKVLFFYYKNFKEVKSKFSEKSVHDLRVTIRRFLAILNVLNYEISLGYLILLRKELKKQLKLYNPLRDNQVQIIKIKALLATFPVLTPFLKYLNDYEDELLRTIKSKIEDKSDNEISELVFFLKLQLKQELPNSGLTCLKLVNSAFIEFQNVKQKAVELDKNDLDTFHQLRLAFKKFRYTMEFLQPILNLPDSYYKKMKSFQDLLGEIQDNRVLFENFSYWIMKYDMHNQAVYMPVLEYLINTRQNLFKSLFKKIKVIDNFWDEQYLNQV